VEAALDLAAPVRTLRFRALGYSPGALAEDAPLGREEVLARVRARVLGGARRWLPPADAEDVAQETLLLLATKYAHVSALEELVAIAARIVRYKCSAHGRKAGRRRSLGHVPPPVSTGDDVPDPLDAAPSGAPDPEAVALTRQRLSLLVEAAARLDGRCREILRRKLQGASFVEIASELGRPVNTIYSWDHRCHQRLKALLGERWPFVSGREQAR
jgi:RNA polymerase sigma factor (sigma-70 family)